jgi:farnesyl diphosphate synthase
MNSKHTGILASWRDEIDLQLKLAASLGVVAEPAGSNELQQACEYVLSGGGKRLRGLLTCSVWADLATSGKSLQCRALSAAVALEVLHAASLVHDDLPALDNDDVRRGKPSCHKEFNEATAILTGDALVGAAVVHVSADEGLSTDERARLVGIIGTAWRALCMGQHLDLAQAAATDASAQRPLMISLKTGALFGAAVACGALCAGQHDARLSEYYRWGVRVGECFQALDDLDDGDRPESDRAGIQKECGEVHAMANSLHSSLRGGVTSTVLSLIMPV